VHDLHHRGAFARAGPAVLTADTTVPPDLQSLVPIPSQRIPNAVAKLDSGAVQFDVFVPELVYLEQLVVGKILQPLNLSYIPNLKANVWPSLNSPWYDVGSRYTVPYTVFSTGIAWRNDFLPDYNPEEFANPYDSFWQMGEISGKVAMLDDQREGLAFGLLRNGITDVNTGKKDQVEGAKGAIQELIDKVNLRFYTNDYQHIADGSIWLHQAWGGDMTAIGYYLPKGTPVTSVSYWWPTDGRGLIGTGTPWPPVPYKGTNYRIGQANNALVYPGIGLGTIVSGAEHVTDGMLLASAQAIASLVDVSQPGAGVLPDVSNLRASSATVAVAVAQQAVKDGVAHPLNDPVQAVQDAMWQAAYRPLEVK